LGTLERVPEQTKESRTPAGVLIIKMTGSGGLSTTGYFLAALRAADSEQQGHYLR